MKDENPLMIQLYNMQPVVVNRFLKEKLYHSVHYLNGVVNTSTIDEFNYINTLPSNVHESDFIIIDTAAHKQEPSKKASNWKIKSPKNANGCNIMPIDLELLMDRIHSTEHEQCIIVFMSNYFEAKYNIKINDNDKIFNFSYNLTGLKYDDSNQKPIVRNGNYFQKPNRTKYEDITNLLMRYTKDMSYKVIFPLSNSRSLLNSKSGEVVSIISEALNKKIFFFPDIKDKASFLAELITDVFATGNHGFITRNLSEYGTFKWKSDFSYISHAERNLFIAIENEKERHFQELTKLESNLEKASQKDENVKLRNLLTESGDILKDAIQWFLEHIGFDNIENPDESYKNQEDKLLEEDIRVITPEVTYIIETKGLGGTSSDADCAQPSKVALRKQDTDIVENNGTATTSYKAVYIVNSQRYKEPKVRDNPPFKTHQITDARIANRAMTTTYELFSAFHMIEAGLLTKAEVRRAFNQNGLVNFKQELTLLTCDTRFDKVAVYSFDLTKGSNVVIDEKDVIAFQDEEDHWHLSAIEEIQVNGQKVTQATATSGGSAGVKLDKYEKTAKNFYLKKHIS